MIFNPLTLQGAFTIDVQPNQDNRGFFTRTFCEREFAENLATCKSGRFSVRIANTILYGRLEMQQPSLFCQVSEENHASVFLSFFNHVCFADDSVLRKEFGGIFFRCDMAAISRPTRKRAQHRETTNRLGEQKKPRLVDEDQRSRLVVSRGFEWPDLVHIGGDHEGDSRTNCRKAEGNSICRNKDNGEFGGVSCCLSGCQHRGSVTRHCPCNR